MKVSVRIQKKLDFFSVLQQNSLAANGYELGLFLRFLLNGILFFVNLYRWVQFERVLEELVAQRIHYTTVEQLQIFAREDCLTDDDDEFQTMLNFYHDLGLIIKHRSTVVLEAKWLIDLFKELITIPHFDKAVRKK